MSYTLLPNSGETLGGTRNDIRTNFVLIQTAFAVNHIGYGLTGQGKHSFVQMPEIAIPATPPTTLANEAALFTDVGAGPAETNFFIRGEANGGSYQLTRLDQANFATFGTNTAYIIGTIGGWTFLPGGLILNYGITAILSGTTAITFAKPYTSFPQFSGSAIADGLTVGTPNLKIVQFSSTTQFFVISSVNCNIYWSVIGK